MVGCFRHGGARSHTLAIPHSGRKAIMTGKTTKYPQKVRFRNSSDTHTKFVTREIEPLKGSPVEEIPYTEDELETIIQAVIAREKTNVVIASEREKKIVLEALERFRDGIAHPGTGAEWATANHRTALNRVIEGIREIS